MVVFSIMIPFWTRTIKFDIINWAIPFVQIIFIFTVLLCTIFSRGLVLRRLRHIFFHSTGIKDYCLNELTLSKDQNTPEFYFFVSL